MSVPFYNLLFNLVLDESGAEPIYLQLTGRIADVIRLGKIQPGAPMPGTRTLAKALKISRNAAIAAYGELSNQGWIQTEVGFGTRVALTLPDFGPGLDPSAKPLATACGFSTPEFVAVPGGACGARVDLRDPICDSRLIPETELARAFRQPITRLHL
ncbi:MAG: winged helix-turn-helix transcriptional regulator, partial [Acidobacteriota bacterium]|nr:winged helix-turn-helix transcriptional regulator [Acidobacteriota bacterium]